MEQNKHPGALSDITVIDLTRVLSGPFATMWLGEMGANIIKVEIPNGGDESRRNPVFVNGISSFFVTVNRNKRSITLNLKSEEGKAVFKELVKKADVVIENFRPDVMDRLGLGYDPQLVLQLHHAFVVQRIRRAGLASERRCPQQHLPAPRLGKLPIERFPALPIPFLIIIHI